MQPESKQLKIGKFRIPDPCTLSWEALEASGGPHKQCLKCGHAVMDLSSMTPKEIERAYRANGGKLCGAVSLDDNGNPILLQERPAKTWRYLSQAAAAASLLLLAAPLDNSARPGPKFTYQASAEMAASHGIDPKSNPETTAPSPETNTLVSGVILTEYGSEIHDSLEVVIRHGVKVVSRQMAVGGFFHVDLDGRLTPRDEITVEVHGKTFNPGVKYRERKYGNAKLTTTLGLGQNLQLTVEYTPPKRSKLMGAVRF